MAIHESARPAAQLVLLLACLGLGPAATGALAQDKSSPGAQRLAGWKLHQAMEAASPFKRLPWRALGPKNCGGRIESIDSPKGHPEIIYAGVGSGGVWKSGDGGITWTHVFAKESTFAIGDLSVDPSDTNTIWVGTGEAHMGGNSYSGTGIFKSTDAGQTWSNMGLVDSGRITKVVIDPKDGERLFVATVGSNQGPNSTGGVYQSTDGGKTWRASLTVGKHTPIIDLVLDPFDSKRLWAAAWDRRRSGSGGVFRTTDGGASWTQLKGGLLQGKDVGRIALAAAGSEPGVVYALMVDHSPPGNGRYDVGGVLYRTTDHGDSWARTCEEYVDTYVGWDFCDVMVSPADADQVYICGQELLCSEDGGKSFERGGEEVTRTLEHPGKGMHLDMHDLWIDPANTDRILLGNDGGLYVSTDRARSWLHLNSLPVAEFYTVYLDHFEPYRIWGGTQDNASLVAPLDTQLVEGKSDDWRYVFLDRWDGGDGFATFPDPSGDGTQYYEHQNGDMRRKLPGAPARWGRGSGKRIRPRAKKGEESLRFSWNTPLFPSVHEKGVLYCGTQYAMRSRDRGDTWERISGDLTGGGGALICLAESALDPKRLASGARGGRVHVTKDGGEHWSSVGAGLPRKSMRRVRPSIHDPERLFVCLSGAGSDDRQAYVFESRDFGANWTSLSANLPPEPVNVLVEDPSQVGILYLGTDLGVYASLDDGASWLSLSAGLPTAPVTDLAVHHAEPTLVLVTHGLSAFACDLTAIRAAKD